MARKRRAGLLAYGLGWDNMEWYPFCQSDIQALVKGGDTRTTRRPGGPAGV
ncbi:MAG: hypothetical protein ACLTYN_08495 [Dysosmobacter welbionis]